MVGCVLSLHSWLWKRSRPMASAFSTSKNIELPGLYPMHIKAFNTNPFITCQVGRWTN